MTSVLSSSPLRLDRVENLADRPIDLHHDVAEQARSALAAELVGHIQRHVDHRVRHVEKERPRLVAVDEVDGVLGVLRRELRLIVARRRRHRRSRCFRIAAAGGNRRFRFGRFGRRASPDPDGAATCRSNTAGRNTHRSHAAAAGTSGVARVPLAEDRGGVAAAAAQLGERDFVGVDAVLRTAD